MACLVKAPASGTKGVLVFTTQERDRAIYASAGLRSAVEGLRNRFVIGLHHNWHDHKFRYDPLFDFSMAGVDDLREESGKTFPLVQLDACNFAPSCFVPGGEKFWDVVCVSRAVAFKNMPDMFTSVRALYDQGHDLRILYLCPVPPAELDTPGVKIRDQFEAIFSTAERKRFTLLTMDFDYPFPLDMETLSFFYRASRVFVHGAADERRVRVAGYAWATGIPIVGTEGVGSLLSEKLRRPPYFYEVERPDNAADAILQALRDSGRPVDFGPVRDEVCSAATGGKLTVTLQDIFRDMNLPFVDTAMALQGLDIRLGRHHGLPVAAHTNMLSQGVDAFVAYLAGATDEQILRDFATPDPEQVISLRYAPATAPKAATPAVRTSVFNRFFGRTG